MKGCECGIVGWIGEWVGGSAIGTPRSPHTSNPSPVSQHPTFPNKSTTKQDVAAATTDFGFFRVLEDKLTEMYVCVFLCV